MLALCLTTSMEKVVAKCTVAQLVTEINSHYHAERSLSLGSTLSELNPIHTHYFSGYKLLILSLDIHQQNAQITNKVQISPLS
jgi:hypothetical protein